MTLRLYNAETAGSVVWQETQTGVPITKGNFSVLLGQVTPLNADWSQPLWLSLQVNADAELAPRQRITSVPLAVRAEVAESLVGGGANIGAIVYNSAAISIPTTTYTILTFNSEERDSDNIHSTTSNTDRLTAQTAGLYWIFGQVYLGGNNGNQDTPELDIEMNAGGTLIGVGHTIWRAGAEGAIQVGRLIYLNVGDYVRLGFEQRSTATNNVSRGANYSAYFSMVRVP